MTSFIRTSRLTLASLTLVLVAGACGVSREDAASDHSSTSQTSTNETAIVFGGDPEDVVASIAFADGSDQEITNGELADAARAVLDSEGFVTLAFGGTAPETIDSDVLTQMIGDRIIGHAYEVSGGTITDEAIEEAKTLVIADLTAGFGAGGSTDAAADAEKAAGELGPYFELMASIRAGVDGLGEILATEQFPCVSHILVATEPEAQALLVQLDAGADFATLAMESSTDPGSGSAGGVLGCQAPDSWVPEFRDAMLAAEVGEVTDPVQSEFGYHLILVTGSEANGEAAAQTALEAEVAGATVQVDDSVGSWVDGRVVPTP